MGYTPGRHGYHPFGEMMQRLREDGGFTYDPRYGTFPTQGFSVTLPPEGRKDWASFWPETMGSADIGQFIYDHYETLMGHGNVFVGAWRADDRDALDLVLVLDDEDSAMRVARVGGQDAIYNLATGEEVSVS